MLKNNGIKAELKSNLNKSFDMQVNLNNAINKNNKNNIQTLET